MATKKKQEFSCIPPNVQLRERNEYGLICSSDIEYVYQEDGFIDWRKMVKPEYLVSNKQRTNEKDVSKLDDKDILILLGGIKELAQIRGFTSVNYSVVSPSPEYVVATCTIKWIPNYETEGKEVEFSGIGDASPYNTTDFARKYLGPIAENRAFVRCVRNFLKINVVAFDEICTGTPAASAPSNDESINFSNPTHLLQKAMRDKKVSFEALKSKCVKEGYANANEWDSVSDIPGPKIFELIGRLQNKK